MSQQLQITGGAKVRDLQDVIIGTSGVLSSLAFNVANGVPKLDVNGKILVSQLPNSVMEYLGTWDASTNTPTLVNGTGNQGDVYLCNVAGTVNFGAGPITFAVGDSAIYSGTIWQKAGGATGTVTSVGLTSTGNDAITITGSPITTSGNINLGFAGTNLQYINGAGDLTTFPTLISSIGLSMPSAFSVANSPLTSNGTIAVTGAGYPSQYIRGDGTLADFPTSGGGGSSVSYYLNGGTSQGTIGGVTYYEMSKTADTGTGVDFTKSGDGFIVAFLTDAGDPAQLNIPAGNWNYEIYASMSANGGTPQMYAELYVYDGTTFTLISTSTNEILYDGTNLNLYSFGMTVPATILTLTDRLAIKLYATNSGGKTTTVHTQDSHLCQIITTFSTGITALNGLTAQVQYFATGTSGTDFNISSTTATHTFNLPVASASNTGKLSSTDWSTFNGKVPYTGATSNVDLGLFSLKANGILAYGNGTAGGVVSFTQTGTLAGIATGVASIGSVSAGKLNIYFGDAGLEAAILDNSLLTADRTYNFPDASGTLALLESTQTFSGTNTFGFIKADNGVLLKNGVVPASTGYTGIGAGIGTGIDITMSGSIYTQSLYFQTSAAYIYTFPAATGTLALTSDLGSYVTLATTQTISGAKTFSASVVNDDGLKIKFGSASNLTASYLTLSAYGTTGPNTTVLRLGTTASTISELIFSQSSSYAYTYPSATGTLALGTGTTNYHAKWTGTNTIGNSLIWDNGTNVGIGNTNTSYTLDVSGTLRNTTSAYFATTSGSVGIGTSSPAVKLDVQNSGGTIIQSKDSSAFAGVVIDAHSSSTPFSRYSSSGTGKFELGYFGSKFYFNNNTGVNDTNAAMVITSAGNVGIGTSSPSKLLHLYNTAGTDVMLVESTQVFSTIAFKSSTNASTVTLGIDGAGNAAFENKLTTGAMAFVTNGSERMRITSTGNVGIGATGYTSTRLLVRGADSTGSNYAFITENSGTFELLSVRNDGALGTGTASSAPYNLVRSGRVMMVDSGGVVGYQASTRESKTNINNLIDVSFLYQLNPVSFNYRKTEEISNTFTDEFNEDLHYGLIADEVEKVNKELVFYNEKDGVKELAGVEYGKLTAVLIKAIQEQNQTIQSLQEQNQDLKSRLDKAGL